MQITEKNIQDLYKFTRKHYVYHYDVQTELVDHLANDIEEIWKENPKLSFEQARDKSFKKFGIFGFMDVVEEKQKQMNKRYWKIIWRFTKEWFTVPKVITTITLFLMFIMLLKIPYSIVGILAILVSLVIVEMYLIYKFKKRNKQKEQNKEKIFLLEEMLGTTKSNYTGFVFINLFNTINLTRIEFSSLQIYWIVLIASVMTLLCIIFYVANYVLPEKAEELLEETYPEYKIVKSL